MDEQNDKKLHTGHRERLKDRFFKEGLAAFEDHQALELLLFYAIPRRDTNELSHRLLRTFGNMRNLFESDVADIMNVPGIGKNTAILIKLLPEIATKYWFVTKREGVKIDSIHSAAVYFQSLLFGKAVEHFYVACLDASYQVKLSTLLSKGTPSQTPVFVRQIAEAALRSGTELILIAHNHPGGSVLPSKSDIELTISIQNAMEALQVKLLDHFIISNEDYYSFVAQQLMRSNYTQEQAHAAKYATGVMNHIPVALRPQGK